jgi:hypothetical protein
MLDDAFDTLPESEIFPQELFRLLPKGVTLSFRLVSERERVTGSWLRLQSTDIARSLSEKWR